ncbi:MAG: pantoate--beta-alanine ligase, partial [Acidimicrobiales bacterium]
VSDCDVVATTIFVNPLQFGPAEDLAHYPRDLERDRDLASDAGVAHLFAPSLPEMYPDGLPLLTQVSVAELGDDLEGASRPAHFSGVATVVAKLFNITGACRAYFGEKDWQQLQLVSRMARDLSFPVEVVGCPIVREADGLAMSSRNIYLDPEQRAAAPVVHRALVAGQHSDDPEKAMAALVAEEPLATLDYAAATDDRLLVAVRFGATRLIDNMPRHPAPAADQPSSEPTRS